MPYYGLYSQLSAIEAIGVCRQGPGLNARGERILRYLQKRRGRMNQARPCPCGSGQMSWWEFDARGIELCRACSVCRAEKLKRYRPEVLSNPNYSCDEPIDAD